LFVNWRSTPLNQFNLTTISACIFDLDGVIVDTAHYHFLAWKRLAAEFGIELTEDYNERLKGVSRMDSLDIILSLGEVSLDKAHKEALATKKNGWYLEYIQSVKSDDALPNVVPFLTDLKQNNIRLAVGSSSKNAKPILARLGLTEMFEVVVDGNDLTFSKPHPEVFLKACERLGKSPEQCVVFEDAQSGVQAAKLAGMRCVGIGSMNILGEADEVIPSFKDFSADTLLTIFSAVPET